MTTATFITCRRLLPLGVCILLFGGVLTLCEASQQKCVVPAMVLPSPSFSQNKLLLSRKQVLPIITGIASGLTFGRTSFANAAETSAASSISPPTLMVPGTGGRVRPNKIVSTVDGKSWVPDDPIVTKLGKSRILATELSPLSGSLSPLADRELYYAPFLFGAWNVTATLQQKMYPYGYTYMPFRSLVEGSPRNRNEVAGDVTSYEAHFFSTIADNVSNKMVVNLGMGIPKSQVIADRSFNAISTSVAYKQLTPVKAVEWNPTKDPTRLTFEFGAGPLADDMRPLGPRRSEVYITGRDTETDATGKVFCAVERSRSVTLIPGDVIVSDSESITEYTQIDENTVSAVSRIAVYLTPNPNSREGVLWQEVGGRAVAFFDYELQMKRLLEETSPGQLLPCVRTPKDYIQCG